MPVPVALATAGAAVALAKAVADVAGLLNTSRTCVIELQNHTNFELTRLDTSHDHGGFEVPPNEVLPAVHAEVYGSQSKSGSVMTGTEGSVTYHIGGGDAKAKIRWNVPFAGDNDVNGSATGGWHGSSFFRVAAIAGAGNKAHMKYEVREIGPFRFGDGMGKVEAVTLIQNRAGDNLELIARAGDTLQFMWRVDGRWEGPFQLAGGAGGNPVLLQSSFGENGNFELVYPDHERGIQFMWRNNDDSAMPWSAPFRFGENLGKVDAVTMIQSNFAGNLELIARVGDTLQFMWRIDGRWEGPFQLAGGAGGNPVLIQSSYGEKGNFELVYPDHERGIQFMWRNNDDSAMPWSAPFRFAEDLGKVDAVTMIQSNFGDNLELIARVGDTLQYMWRIDGRWYGPNQLVGGAAGNPVLIQSRFGGRGNFELVYPDHERGIQFMWRNNDV